jgi:hypothetical protein
MIRAGQAQFAVPDIELKTILNRLIQRPNLDPDKLTLPSDSGGSSEMAPSHAKASPFPISAVKA